jgi:hypothetical protein
MVVTEMFIYYGDLPNFTDCTTNNQSGVNMIAPRSALCITWSGGTLFDTYACSGLRKQKVLSSLVLTAVAANPDQRHPDQCDGQR